MQDGLDRAPDVIVKKPYSDLLAIADRAAWSLYRSNPSARLYGIDDLKAEAYLGLMLLGLDRLAEMDGGWVYGLVRDKVRDRVQHIYGKPWSAKSTHLNARTADAHAGISVDVLVEAGWDRPTHEDVVQRVLDLVHGRLGRLGVHPAEHTGPHLPLATPMASETGLERSNLSPVPALVPVAAWCVPDRLGPDLVAVPRA